MEYIHIERLLGLHQSLHIIYVVDEYISQFYTDDEKKLFAAGVGKTVRESLIDLNSLLEKVVRE